MFLGNKGPSHQEPRGETDVLSLDANSSTHGLCDLGKLLSPK